MPARKRWHAPFDTVGIREPCLASHLILGEIAIAGTTAMSLEINAVIVVGRRTRRPHFGTLPSGVCVLWGGALSLPNRKAALGSHGVREVMSNDLRSIWWGVEPGADRPVLPASEHTFWRN